MKVYIGDLDQLWFQLCHVMLTAITAMDPPKTIVSAALQQGT